MNIGLKRKLKVVFFSLQSLMQNHKGMAISN